MKRLRDQPPEAEINDGPIFSLRELLRPEWVVPHRCLPWVTDFSVAASPRDYLERKGKGTKENQTHEGERIKRCPWVLTVPQPE